MFANMSSACYRRLPNASTIRLLCIEPWNGPGDQLVCTLSFLDLKNESGYSGYSAASYEWGQDNPSCSITLNGHTNIIRRNLYNFLIQARSNGWYKNLWIDALCINQDDVQERNCQVSMMSEIYSRACHVLVWLGKLPTSTTSVLSELDQEIDVLLKDDRAGWLHDGWKKFQRENFRDGMRTLVRNTYWKRKWIIQEIGLSGPNASLIVGHKTIPLHRVKTFIFEAQKFMSGDNWYRSDIGVFPNLISGTESMTCKPWPLSLLISVFGEHKCKESKDHIYALLSLAKEYGIKVDYTRDIVEEYWEVLTLLHLEEDTAFELRRFSAHLQYMLQISDNQLLDSWINLDRPGVHSDLFGYQFIEATQMMLGVSSLGERKWKLVPHTNKWSTLPIFTFDCEELYFARKESKARDDVLALFWHVVNNHQSTLDDSTQRIHFGPCLGDYFVGIISGSVVEDLKDTYSMQKTTYKQGAKLIPFKLDDLPFIYEPSIYIDSYRYSDLRHLYLESAQHVDSEDQLVAVQDGDFICMFSGNHSALIIRRTSEDEAICGAAIIKMKSATSFERLERRMSRFTDRLHGIDKAKAKVRVPAQRNDGISTGTEEEEKPSAYKEKMEQVFHHVSLPRLCSVQVFFKPHCVLKVSNWTPHMRLLHKPFVACCKCKPGEGGCR